MLCGYKQYGSLLGFTDTSHMSKPILVTICRQVAPDALYMRLCVGISLYMCYAMHYVNINHALMAHWYIIHVLPKFVPPYDIVAPPVLKVQHSCYIYIYVCISGIKDPIISQISTIVDIHWLAFTKCQYIIYYTYDIYMCV